METIKSYLMSLNVLSNNRVVYCMKKTGLLTVILFLAISSLLGVCQVNGAQLSFSDSTVEYYLVKQVITATSDWQDINWSQGLDVHTVRYAVTEGEEAVNNIGVAGLTVALDQSLDTEMIVVEIEALVVKNSDTAIFEVNKGSIGYVDIELQVYDVTLEEFVPVTMAHTVENNEVHHFNLAAIFSHPAGNMSLTENLKDLKGKVYAFYYPWYNSPNGPSAKWDHWLEVTENSIFDSTNYPLHGAYDSNDENIIRSHMAIIKQAGIDGIIVSWWGADGYEAQPLDEVFRIASEFDLEVSLYYESVRDMSQEWMIDEFLYIYETYTTHPAFMKDDGVPVVFVYAINAYQRTPEFWQGVRDAVESDYGEHIMIGDTSNVGYLDVFDGFHLYIWLDEGYPELFETCINNFEVGTSLLEDEVIFQRARDNEDLELIVKPFMTTVVPSFDARSWGRMDPLVERLGGETYEGYWDVSRDLEPHSILVTSWNEWHEGTEMEPSREYGFSYIQMTKDFIEEYKGVTIPIDEVSYSASPVEFTHSQDGTGSGIIRVDAQQGHTLYVNVTVEWGTDIQSAEIDCGPYIYLRKIRDNLHSIMIPSIPSGESLDVTVKYETDVEQPELRVTVTAYDQAGYHYELLDSIASSTEVVEMTSTNVNVEVEEDALTAGDTVQVAGSIDPSVPDVEVSIEHTKPDGTKVTITRRTDSNGKFSSALQLSDPGTWRIKASWQGNEEYSASESMRITVDVEEEQQEETTDQTEETEEEETDDEGETKKPVIPGYPVEAIVLALMLFMLYSRLTQKTRRVQFSLPITS